MAKKKKPEPAAGQTTLTSFFAGKTGKTGKTGKGSKGTKQEPEAQGREAPPPRTVPESPVVLGAQVKTVRPPSCNSSLYLSSTCRPPHSQLATFRCAGAGRSGSTLCTRHRRKGVQRFRGTVVSWRSYAGLEGRRRRPPVSYSIRGWRLGRLGRSQLQTLAIG